ncbi:helicase [Enterobacter mori]|uniref:helicase n=1 Tax=Enterobacter mori TaxID=539813 RepID=UPI0035C5D79C
MSEKKSIDDKMLLRAIADMVIQNPSYAREIFNDAHDIINIFPELTIINDFLLQPHENNYQEILEKTIKEIPDTETKKIFLMAFSSKGK